MRWHFSILFAIAIMVVCLTARADTTATATTEPSKGAVQLDAPGYAVVVLPPTRPTERPPAEKIVFICDASSAMAPFWDFLKQELSRTLEKLIPIQSYDLFMAHDGTYEAVNGKRLIAATPDNRKRTEEFVKAHHKPAGRANPLNAIAAAFAEEPDLVFLLLADIDESIRTDDLIGAVRKANQQRHARVVTILISEKDLTALREALTSIAAEHGGAFRRVSAASATSGPTSRPASSGDPPTEKSAPAQPPP